MLKVLSNKTLIWTHNKVLLLFGESSPNKNFGHATHDTHETQNKENMYVLLKSSEHSSFVIREKKFRANTRKVII